MNIIRTVMELRAAVQEARAGGASIGLVPTMGAFHDGHVSLMRRAKERCELVIVSLFVNPAQFNEKRDLENYPRDERRDAAMADGAGVAILFAPGDAEVYPNGFSTVVEVQLLSEPLEGEVRGPVHFRGVATVVTKLLNMAQADVAFFGQKDAQQALIIRRLARDLDIATQIEICPTVREQDGLAMSSRNVLLDAESRARAPILARALFAVRDAVLAGERDVSRVMAPAQRMLADAGVELEYFAAVSANTLLPVATIAGETLIAIAARFGSVRLIDNVLVGGTP